MTSPNPGIEITGTSLDLAVLPPNSPGGAVALMIISNDVARARIAINREGLESLVEQGRVLLGNRLEVATPADLPAVLRPPR